MSVRRVRASGRCAILAPEPYNPRREVHERRLGIAVRQAGLRPGADGVRRRAPVQPDPGPALPGRDGSRPPVPDGPLAQRARHRPARRRRPGPHRARPLRHRLPPVAGPVPDRRGPVAAWPRHPAAAPQPRGGDARRGRGLARVRFHLRADAGGVLELLAALRLPAGLRRHGGMDARGRRPVFLAGAEAGVAAHRRTHPSIAVRDPDPGAARVRRGGPRSPGAAGDGRGVAPAHHRQPEPGGRGHQAAGGAAGAPPHRLRRAGARRFRRAGLAHAARPSCPRRGGLRRRPARAGPARAFRAGTEPPGRRAARQRVLGTGPLRHLPGPRAGGRGPALARHGRRARDAAARGRGRGRAPRLPRVLGSGVEVARVLPPYADASAARAPAEWAEDAA